MGDTRIGFLTRDQTSSEQEAARNWLVDRREFSSDWIPVETLESGRVGQYDVLWWHRDEPFGSELSDHTIDAIRAFVESGGGVFLSLYALSLVDKFGFDTVSPDVASRTAGETRTGFLAKTIYEHHPIFDDIRRFRLCTRERGCEVPEIYYHDRVPRRGEVLAASYDEDTDRQNDFALVTWGYGDGVVTGVGAHLAFDHSPSEKLRQNRDKLTGNIVRFLDEGPDEGPPLGTPASENGFDRLRAAVADDPHRPRYHFTPPANWLSDPNGLIQVDGTYHLFYQHNPAGPVHGSIHWGHATSTDLVHWDDQPIALGPGPDGPDQNGCYSGSAVKSDAGPVAMYTGVTDSAQVTCLATASGPDIQRWEKASGNPVVDGPPPDFDVRSTDRIEQDYDYRDPFVWRGEDDWYHLIGTGMKDGGGATLLYQSEDLRDWTCLGRIEFDGPNGTGPVWECPEWFRVDDTDLLHVSDYSHRATDRAGISYFLGEFDVSERRFEVETSGTLDAGRFYAPQSFRDDRGRRILVGWLPESRGPRERWDAGWAGAMSIPRVVSVESGEFRMRPVPEIEELRADHDQYEFVLEDGGQTIDFRDDCLEIRAGFDAVDATEVGLVVRRSAESQERTVVRYQPKSGTVVLDRSEASLNQHDCTEALDEMSVHVDPDDGIDLRVFVDRSIVEVFINERTAITGRIYPNRPDSDGVAVYATGEADASVDIWRIEPAFEM